MNFILFSFFGRSICGRILRDSLIFESHFVLARARPRPLRPTTGLIIGSLRRSYNERCLSAILIHLLSDFIYGNGFALRYNQALLVYLEAFIDILDFQGLRW